MRCSNCKTTKDSDFYPSTLKRTGHNRRCKKCHAEQTNEYRKKNPEYPAQYAKAYRQRKKEHLKNYATQYSKKVRALVLAHYGAWCACCGEEGEQFLTIDHINNDGNLHKSAGGFKVVGTGLCTAIIKMGYPDTFQILCWNCNCGKRINKGVCPHGLTVLADKIKQAL